MSTLKFKTKASGISSYTWNIVVTKCFTLADLEVTTGEHGDVHRLGEDDGQLGDPPGRPAVEDHRDLGRDEDGAAWSEVDHNFYTPALLCH